ncbi:MAG: fibronectin type III domain-containing protein, partial [Bacteroidota bacterium]
MTNNYNFTSTSPGLRLLRRMTALLAMVLLLCLTSTQRVSAQFPASSYSFAFSSGTFTPISGGTVLGAVGAGWDDGFLGTQSIGFNFNYMGTIYTTFGISCNGYIIMGAASQTNTYCGSQGSNAFQLNAWATDFIPFSTTSGEVRYQTIGSAPNRQLVCQWKNVRHFGGPTSGDDYTVQLILNEGSNTIQVVMGPWASATTQGANTCADSNGESGSIGLKGATTADFNLRTITNGTHTWATSITGATVAAVCNTSPTNLATSGQTFTFSPPPPCTTPGDPTSPVAGALTTSSVSGSFTAPGTPPTGYIVVRYPSGGSVTTPATGTSYTIGTALGAGTVIANGTSTSFTSTGLIPSTTYDFKIYSYNNTVCSGGPVYSNLAAISLTTTACAGP